MQSAEEQTHQTVEENNLSATTSTTTSDRTVNEVIVKGLVFSADEHEIGTFMDANFGAVQRVKLLRGPDGRSRGIAFVNFETEESAQKAVDGTRIDFQGRYIIIDHTKPKVEKSTRVVDEESTTVFVGNISFRTDSEDLRKFFTECGTVSYTHISQFAGKSKGFGHVEFSDRAGAEAALAKNGASMDGRPIRVDIAASRDKVEKKVFAPRGPPRY